MCVTSEEFPPQLFNDKKKNKTDAKIQKHRRAKDCADAKKVKKTKNEKEAYRKKELYHRVTRKAGPVFISLAKTFFFK